ncbi:Mg-protoporphyrin IX methyltransferase [Cognatiyoonia koreensis]|uniref:Magnesium protoporphyrin IX methyltransferase n=1 Tax=Cognatiyoonia koreensis TaxID=364200 RepID=A0A1I0RR11_9RHOB|nr:magnesium protoporphyrin IX methyltransferase [Cognatiyoonia koreensis]SEW43717.1 Mg-protoporphyrin IX methyltransferase [Cognatiyoonia koreensis]
MTGYATTRDRVEHYFDRSATKVWEQLTSDAPVSGIRATVRAGRDRMRDLMLAQLPDDLRGMRILDAGCGTGAMAVELAKRGADEVVAVDISPALIDIAKKRMPQDLSNRITWVAGDMFEATHGAFDHAMAMDSLIYYTAADISQIMSKASKRVTGKCVFTLPPRTPALMLMWRAGKLFPRADRSPQMVPHTTAGVAHALRIAGVHGRLKEIERVKSGFYISTALSFEGRR